MGWHEHVLDYLRHLMRFGVAGTAVAVVQTTTYVACTDLGWTGPVLAGVIAFLLGTVVSFTVHYRWTFNTARRMKNAAWRFGVARLVGFGVNTAGIWLVTKALTLSHYWGLVVMLVVTPLTVFTISKFWAFRDIDHYDREAEES